MKTRVFAFAVAFAAACTLSFAQSIDVKEFRFVGPFPVQKPYQIDSVNITGQAFQLESLLDSPVEASLLKDAKTVSELPVIEGNALYLLGFSVENSIFTKANLKIEGLKHYKLTVDGKPCGPALKLEPGTHDFVIKVLSLEDGNKPNSGEQEGNKQSTNTTPTADTLKINITSDKEGRLTLRTDGKHIYSLDANSMGERCGGLSISPSGKYLCLGYNVIDANGKANRHYEIQQTSDGKVIARPDFFAWWLPKSDAYWFTRKTATGRDLMCQFPGTGEEKVLAHNIPEGHFSIAPTEDFLLYSMTQEGPKEGEVHQILTPDDRHPGWRDRNYIAKYDIKTGILQPLTYGFHDVWPADISSDGTKVLFMTQRQRLTQRPTTLFSVWQMDVNSLECELLIEDDGFIRSASYSPDAKQVLLTGSAESFDGIGKNVLEGQIPNQYDVQLFSFDIATKTPKALTKDFAPSIDNVTWSAYDGKIYTVTEDGDARNIYRIDPKTAKAERIQNREEYLYGMDLALTSGKLVYYGQSLCNGDRAYILDTKSGKQRLIHDFSATRFASTQMGEGGAYEFTSSRGDRISCFYVLPPNFDPQKKYPMLVHYYGGCSPTSRYCTGSYSPQVYAAQGYVFLVVNPSGAAGFGQEFAARHVNTAGDVVADDIIEATQNFCAEHPWVNAEKIGCFSASYGGFMTQLLLTKTDIYAAGISHAGISDHTSYWGEGYWGYSYSEVSMADSYPWTRKDLYVDRSPLYNADKIHTPLLFLHGSADTNVPIGESIQMFTALKLLGEDTAFVVVDGEDHGIREFNKQRQWLRTIFAWFSKYLQDDSTWWDTLYPEKNL